MTMNRLGFSQRKRLCPKWSWLRVEGWGPQAWVTPAGAPSIMASGMPMGSSPTAREVELSD